MEELGHFARQLVRNGLFRRKTGWKTGSRDVQTGDACVDVRLRGREQKAAENQSQSELAGGLGAQRRSVNYLS